MLPQTCTSLDRYLYWKVTNYIKNIPIVSNYTGQLLIEKIKNLPFTLKWICYAIKSNKWRKVITIESIFYKILNSQVSFGHLLTRKELSRRQLHFTWKLTLTCVIGHNYSPTAFWKILLLLIFIVSSYELMLITQSSTLTTKSEFAIYLLHVCAKKNLI